MQSATHSHAAHYGPGYYSLGGYQPSSLGFNNDISFNPSLDGLYTQSSSHVWPVGDSEYAALEALANSRMVASHAHINYEVGDRIHARYAHYTTYMEVILTLLHHIVRSIK